MILLDTNVVSELIKPNLNPQVSTWFRQFRKKDTFTSSISEAELRYGIAVLPEGARKQNLTMLVDEFLKIDFDGRVLPFTQSTAATYALIMTERRKIGRPMGILDAQIASIAKNSNLYSATRNIPDFQYAGIQLINPWET